MKTKSGGSQEEVIANAGCGSRSHSKGKEKLYKGGKYGCKKEAHPEKEGFSMLAPIA